MTREPLTAAQLSDVERTKAAVDLTLAIQAKGSDATSLRDAAHEAHHALYAGLKPKWTRDRIHAAIMKKARVLGRRMLNTQLVVMELDARAVEWIVCERFGVEYEPEKWADITWWETIKNMRIELPEEPWILDRMKECKELDRVKRYADAVIALGAPALKPLSPAELDVVSGKTQLCVSCGKPKKGHRYRHPFKAMP